MSLQKRHSGVTCYYTPETQVKEHIDRATEILVAAGANRVYLFGSSARDLQTARDLDLACSGIPPQNFMRAYGELLMTLPVGVDLLDLDRETPVSRVVARRARLLYERS
ncbi:MAG: nucleotidyltransferase domain-containing protein [Candidatus Wallbacteria bacterium]|nr:nucleotidyltransferase domain-containing protein [Candidatus Wallbacteria bacterium]